MTRSLLQPIRTRRVVHSAPLVLRKTDEENSTLTPGTRKTLAAIGALWVSFAVTSSGNTAVRTPRLVNGSNRDAAASTPSQTVLPAAASVVVDAVETQSE
jgi:predicted HAD superfamily phosphohydrolase